MNLLSYLCLVLAAAASSDARTFTFQNNGDQTVWVGALGNDGKPAPNNGGWELDAGATTTVDTDEDWAGRFWGRTNCNYNDGGQFVCETGDCGGVLECNGAGGAPPVTLAEITLSGAGGLDYYDISLVDGFNLPMTIAPSDRGGCSDRYQCNAASCTADVLGQCPAELQQTGENGVVACESACLAFDTDQYCCRGDHGTPETCEATAWPKDYASFFKGLCPDAYSYAYDDMQSTFTCKSTGYTITFN